MEYETARGSYLSLRCVYGRRGETSGGFSK